MNASILHDMTMTHEACLELIARLQEVRSEMDDEAWDAATEGPLGEILCAAMDIEYLLEKYEES